MVFYHRYASFARIFSRYPAGGQNISRERLQSGGTGREAERSAANDKWEMHFAGRNGVQRGSHTGSHRKHRHKGPMESNACPQSVRAGVWYGSMGCVPAVKLSGCPKRVRRCGWAALSFDGTTRITDHGLVLFGIGSRKAGRFPRPDRGNSFLGAASVLAEPTVACRDKTVGIEIGITRYSSRAGVPARICLFCNTILCFEHTDHTL